MTEFHLSFEYGNQQFDVGFTEAPSASDKTVLFGNKLYTVSTKQEQIQTVLQLLGNVNNSAPEAIKDYIIAKGATNTHLHSRIQSAVGHILPASEQTLAVRPTIRLPNAPAAMPVEERMKELGIHGVSVAVIQDGTIKCQGFGNAHDESCLFQAASISKTVTALTILSLIENGAVIKKDGQKIPLTLDTDVRTILDEKLWKSIDPSGTSVVTIKQLLSHTAGLRADTKEGFPGYEPSSTPLPTLDDILLGNKTNSPPVSIDKTLGNRFAYSGGGSMILQKVIELATGDFTQAVRDHVFAPLGLKNSHFTLPETASPLHGERDHKPLPYGSMRHPELAAAGLWTTPHDLAHIALEMQKCWEGKSKIFGTETAKMFTSQDRSGDRQPGLGVFVEEHMDSYFFHDGSNLGFRCLMVANNHGQGAVVMTNSDHGNDIIPEIVRSIAETGGWEDRDALHLGFPPISPEIAEANSNPQKIDPISWVKPYLGRYQFDDYLVEIALVDNKVMLIADEGSFEVTPLSQTCACYQEQSPGPLQELIFHTNADGTPSLMRYGAPHAKTPEPF